ncbi:EamA domain-containing membrane protein RarD [Reichenbachiella faecimaris]|uniref:EamA domain-containing membrane protein RarD n=1 Tax=Reichenbachiella faecimaris TaxID=692418 RepID=A0A1W2GL38_REIFA|nr:DMT family transporter [Reichenbachiella faecimaris]SMD37078.1 EamA domain-containing membrane protein RarD [Reichenbachiella faecimaris]
MNSTTSHFPKLIVAIVVMSTSGVLARAMDISPELAIWLRSVIAAMALGLVLKFMKLPLWIKEAKALTVVVFSTILFGLHWVSYFYALYYSSVAIGMLSLFTYPVFTAILEPIIVKSKPKLIDIALSFVAFFGVFFLVPDFDLTNDVTLGVVIGVCSALTYSLRNIMLKLHVQHHSGITLMFMQVIGLSVLLSPIFFLGDMGVQLDMIAIDWWKLLTLGLLTTAIGHTLFVVSFKNFSITVISILSTLTPLIGIGLGFLFLDELPQGNVWIGGFLISVAVLVESVKSAKRQA